MNPCLHLDVKPDSKARGGSQNQDPPYVALRLVFFVFFVAFVPQKSICALNFTNRDCKTLLGRSHVSVVVTKVWL